MKISSLISMCACIVCFGMLAACTNNCVYGNCGGGSYSYETNARTSPSICDSACPNPCDLSCAHDNVNYRGCGDNCVMP
jgi:hypothetical protein